MAFLESFGGLLAPDPSGDPEAFKRQTQLGALLQLGLGTLAASGQPGATFGSSLGGGAANAAQFLQQSQQRAFEAGQEKRREQREERLLKAENDRAKIEQAEAARKERQETASVAKRISAGIGNAKGRELQYLSLVGRTPEFQQVATQYGFDPAQITTPEQVIALGEQLGSLGGLGSDPLRAPQTPAEIQEFQYYQSLSPEDKKTYLQVKRNSQPYQLADLAGGQVVINRVTGEIIPQTTAAQEGEGRGVRAAGEASGKTIGEARAAAQIDLPRIENNATLAIAAIEELKAAPGLPGIFGVKGAFPNFPGSKAADAEARLDQVKGKTFLEAFNSLKGAGAITDTEGKKATDAIARLGKAQSLEAATAALNELQGVIERGLEVARSKAAAPQPAADYSSMSDDEIKRRLGL